MKTFKKILKDELKAKGLEAISKKIKSVTSDYNTARVKTVNLFKEERKALQTILDSYERGHFDGMQDLYVYDSNREKKEIDFKFVFLNNEFTEDLIQKAKQNLKDSWDITDDKSAQAKRGVWYDTAIHRDLCDLQGE